MDKIECPACHSEICMCGYMYRDLKPMHRMRIACGALGVSYSILLAAIDEHVPIVHPLKGMEFT